MHWFVFWIGRLLLQLPYLPQHLFYHRHHLTQHLFYHRHHLLLIVLQVVPPLGLVVPYRLQQEFYPVQ